jgi:hypothetical protein
VLALVMWLVGDRLRALICTGVSRDLNVAVVLDRTLSRWLLSDLQVN